MLLTSAEAELLKNVSTETEWDLLEKFSHLDRVFGNPEEIEAESGLQTNYARLELMLMCMIRIYIRVPRKVEFEILDLVHLYSKHDDVATNPKTSAFSKSGTCEAM